MAHRNAPCDCGSGKKYKACCAVKRTRPQWLHIIALVAFLVMSGFVVASVIRDAGRERVVPPGYVWNEEHGHLHKTGAGEQSAVPADAVWSAEHGHFHDAAGNPIGGNAPAEPAPAPVDPISPN